MWKGVFLWDCIDQCDLIIVTSSLLVMRYRNGDGNRCRGELANLGVQRQYKGVSWEFHAEMSLNQLWIRITNIWGERYVFVVRFYLRGIIFLNKRTRMIDWTWDTLYENRQTLVMHLSAESIRLFIAYASCSSIKRKKTVVNRTKDHGWNCEVLKGEKNIMHDALVFGRNSGSIFLVVILIASESLSRQ